MKNKHVAIIGRSNVGKSTLFNRLIGLNRAVVNSNLGTTRDRHTRPVHWLGRSFLLSDCGGIDLTDSADIAAKTNEISWQTAETADLIIFLVDRLSGLMPADEQILNKARKLGKPMLLVANKYDHVKHQQLDTEFYSLGFADYLQISAIHNIGISDLLEVIFDKLNLKAPLPLSSSEYPLADQQVPDQNLAVPDNKGSQSLVKGPKDLKFKIMIIGRPNVGKSTLFNRWIGKDRMMVSSIAGTTRDTIAEDISFHQHPLILSDTAGIRPQAQIVKAVEKESTAQSLLSIKKADVCVLLFDVNQGFSHQDGRLVQLTLENNKSLIIAANKWDLVIKDSQDLENYRKDFYHQRQFLKNYDIEFISALKGIRTYQLLAKAYQLGNLRHLKIKVSRFNKFIQTINQQAKFPTRGKQVLTIKYGLQIGTNPLKFSFYVNDPTLVTANFEKYIQNQLVNSFNLRGSLPRIFWRAKSKR